MLTPRGIQSSNPIQFKTQDIEESLKKTGEYIKDNFIIKQLNEFDQYRQEEDIPAEEDYVFALQKKDPKTPFLGVINYFFKREGYCLNTYPNGDIYFGYYNNDLRNKQGIYSYQPSNLENNLQSQYYYGHWDNDLINGNGIYLWLKEKDNITPFSDFNNANFDAFVGKSKFGKFKKGALLTKNGNNNYIYYGEFSDEGKKEGNKCFYYSNKGKLCYGTFKDGVFIEGYVSNFDDEGKINGLIVYKKEEGKNPEAEKIKIEEEEMITNIMTKFINVILSKDYFNMIYMEFGNIITFRNEKMNDIKIIMSDEYEKIMHCFKFNKISICEDIEKNLGF